MWKTGLFFILILSTVVSTASADIGRYIVGPCPPQEELDKLGDAVDMSEVDRTLTFWEFTLSIKIAYTVEYLVAFVSLFKLVPVILDQIKNLSKYRKKKKIINYVLNTPGCTPSEISKDLKISRRCIRHQL